MSGSHPKPDSTHRELMAAMGSKKGYDPIPPDQYLCFLDPEEPRQQRLLAWLRSKTIRVKRPNRTAFAVDERGELGLRHAAGDLGWALSHTSREWAAFEEKGLGRRDEQGRLWLAGNIPAKKRTSSEGEEKAVTCTGNLPAYLVQQYQQLDISRRQQFDHGYQALQRWGEKVEADAIAAARTAREKLEDEFLQVFGMQRERRPKKREQQSEDAQTVQLALLRGPEIGAEIGAVQVTWEGDPVHVANGVSYKTQNGAVHSAHPFRPEEQSEQSEVKGSGAPDPWAEESPTPSRHLPSERPKPPEERILAAVEELVGKIPEKDALRDRFGSLHQQFNIPALAVVRFLYAKFEEKKSQRYAIHNAGALHKFAMEDLPNWIRQNGRQIDACVQIEESERQRWEESNKDAAADLAGAFQRMVAGKGMK